MEQKIRWNYIQPRKTFETNKGHSNKKRFPQLFSVNLRPIGTAEPICVSIRGIVSKSFCSKVVVAREFVW